ncbi:hemicentin-1-like [Wyeomyia smithii]|uniref:hemicentin-1-like n=1 Tax=Wyeomyia smithii TaxID=174621 RepID=UPI002467F5D9|nr:hemicentin-1-like [Wyeomyia smithii]XP_055546343.1 hemicentin-1-like [Wyeomyia smithii]
MQINCLVRALLIVAFAIISAAGKNATDNDELWMLLVSGKLNQIKTNTAPEVTPRDTPIHSETAISGNNNYEGIDKTTLSENDDQLFDFRNSWAEETEQLEKSSGEDGIVTMAALFSDEEQSSVDFDASGELFDDNEEMQADQADFGDDIIDVLRRKPASREVLSLLGLLKEKNETDEMKQKLQQVLRPVSEREGMGTILEEASVPREKTFYSEPLVSDGVHSPQISNILIPKLDTKLSSIRKQYEAPSEGQRSLVIVFDATGSMLDDLKQLRDGAKLIIDEITNLKNNPIYNYVFVPFRDPQVGPRLVTRNKDELLQTLENLQIYGGGDCPEAALAAISSAIEAALPNSFVFVFTDATAKDFKLDQRVLRLVQQKQTPITFLLTGFCDGKSSPGHKVMNDIAAASNGEIFDLKKDQIEQVLLSIKGMLNIDHVPLKAVDSRGAETHHIDLDVDTTLKEFSVSVAGHRPNIEITDPQQVPYNKSKAILDLENVKVVNVPEPIPGKWNIKAGSSSPHSVRLSGNSDVKFKFGFSQTKPTSIATLFRQPVLDADNILTIQPSQTDRIDVLSNVTITAHDTSETGAAAFKFTLPLVKTLLEDSSIVYTTEAFKAPRQKFKISVTGKDVNGNPINRLISTAIQATGLSAPELSLDFTDTELLEGDILQINCRVESLLPVTAQWKRSNRLLVERNFDSTDSLKLRMPNVTTRNSGRYACHARNSIGETEILAVVKVKPRPEPTVGVYPKDIVAFEHEVLIALRCITKNVSPSAPKTWSFNGVKIEAAYGKEYLELYNISSNNAGSYECRVESDGRMIWDSTNVTVEYAPKASGEVSNVATAAYGKPLLLECGLEGNPKPMITWSYRVLDEIEEKPLLETGSSLLLPIVSPEVEGSYICDAKNRHGSTRRTITVLGEANEPPKIPKLNDTILYVQPGETVTVNCSCDLCQPLSEYIWTSDQFTFESSPYETHNNARVSLNIDQTRNAVQYQLTVEHFSAADQGSYSCILSNAHGADSIVVETRLMEAPTVEGILVDDEVTSVEHVGLEDSIHQLTCDSTGLPDPQVFWLLDEKKLNSTDPRFSLRNDNKTLVFIEHFTQDHAGIYQCLAVNPMGTFTSKLVLRYGSSPIFLKTSPTVISAQIGKEISLDCRTSGVPEPKLSWHFNEEPLNKSMPFEATLEDSGIYTCTASNTFGQQSFTTTVVVYGKPQFLLGPPEDTAIAVSRGKNVSLECTATGFPKPNISWTFEDHPINQQNVEFTNTGLLVMNATKLSQGTYVCNAENSVGNSQKVYYLVVKEPPKITANIPERVQLLPEQEIELHCDGEGNPSPRPSWSHNNTPRNSSATLKISHSLQATGNYTCILVNEEGTDRRSTEVTVLTPPTKAGNASEKPQIVQAKLNNSLALVCPFDNYESLLWHLNERNLDSYIDLSDVNALQNILHIDRLRQSHAGTYTCFVENPAGRNNHSFIVGILTPPKIEHIEHGMNDNKDENQHELDSSGDPNIAEVTLLRGEQLRLMCHASGSPQPTIFWIKDQSVITRSSELAIEDIDTHHSGLYTCVAENELGNARKVYRLDVMTSPSNWGEAVSHIEVFKGEDLQLECTMRANPPAIFHWMKDDTILEEFEGALDLSSVQPQDSGLYTCEAENIFGVDEKQFHVTVYQTPEITRFPESQMILISEPLTVTCHANGNPLPVLSIIYRGEVLASTSDLDPDSMELDETYRLKGKTYALGTQLFTATRVSEFDIQIGLHQPNATSNSAGMYLCLAQNAVGYDEQKSAVEVLAPPFVQLNRLKSGLSFHILEGLPLFLFCPISGHPKPTISWFRNSKPIKSSGQTLFLSSTSRKDHGNYTCLGENSVGKQELAFSVSILVPPTMINSIVFRDNEAIADQPEQEEISILKGDNVTLDCASLGNPAPEIYWTKVVYLDEKLNERLPSKDSVLELYSIETTSTYSCYVNNTAGSTQKLFHIVVQSPPQFKQIEYVVKPMVLLHHSLDLNCEMAGVPEVEVFWIKDGTAVNTDRSGFFLASNGHILRISAAQSSDAGEYKCVGRNLHGQVSRKFYVSVEVPVSWSPWGEWSACSSSCGKGTQFRSRICLLMTGSPAHGPQYNCVGENIQIKNCEMLPCPVNGGWGVWSKWSNCSLDCITEFTGMKSVSFRSRKCDSPAPSLGGKPCIGEEREETICNVKFCPINGDWTPWTNWTPCSETCGFGRSIRWRSCANPAPRNGGLPCVGSESELQICKLRECIVDGGWSDWSSWSKCSKSCGVGVRHRKRSCTNPEPKNGGKQCEGENVEVDKCSSKSCRNDALVKTINRVDSKRKFSPLLTYESTHPSAENDYEDISAENEPQKFKIIRNFEFAEAPPVEYIDLPTEQDYEDDQNGYHKIIVSLKNTVNLTQDTTAYNLNFGGVSNAIQFNCMAGMIYNETLRRCVDVNECETGDHSCTGPGQVCVNNKGGYECLCSSGYRMVSDACVDVNECREETHQCSHYCANNPGNYSCYCPSGYTMASDGKTCSKRRTREQPAYSIINYEMTCPEGYFLTGNKCVDIDECAVKEDECSEGQTCLNTQGSYVCVPTACPEEYDEDELTDQCYQDCRFGVDQRCPDGAHIEQTLTYKVIVLNKHNPRQPLATLSIPAYQRHTTETTFAFQERTYGHVFSLEKISQTSGAVHLYGSKRMQRGKIYKLKIVAHAFGIESHFMDYVHKFTVYVHFVEQLKKIS